MSLLFAEIGCGTFPVPLCGEYDFPPGSIYFCAENERERLYGEYGAAILLGRDRPDLETIFYHGSAETIPLETRSVDEVFLGNVVGFPPMAEATLNKIFKETGRILKEDGQLVILETITPRIHPPDELDELLAGSGLLLGDVVVKGQNIWEDSVRPYDRQASLGSSAYRSYLAVVNPSGGRGGNRTLNP